MPFVLLFARLLLCGVFAVSGLSKLADRERTRQSLVGFGVPARLAVPLAIVLIAAELATAAALLPVATAPFGALGALALLSVFSVAILVNLARGRTPDCNCFGQLHSEPIGWSTIARNLVLLAVAVFVAWVSRGPDSLSLVAWLGALSIAQRAFFGVGLVCVTLLAVQGVFLLQVLRQQGRMLLRFEVLESRLGITTAHEESPMPAIGLEPGSPAPTFELDQLGASPSGLAALLSAGKNVLLLFTNPHCGPCIALLPEIASWQRDYADSLTIALVSEGTADENRQEIVAHGIQRLYLQKQREVAEAYRAYGTPAAVVVSAGGTIASYVAQGADAIRRLVDDALTGGLPAAPAAFARLGDAAPALTLRGLDGESVALASLQGERSLLLFWNPSCGFCQQMLPDLQKWEASPQAGAPQVLVVSSGSTDENRAMKLRSKVVIDTHSEAAAAFGANGTPMALLLDAEGRIASEVAAGAKAVFGLLDSRAA